MSQPSPRASETIAEYLVDTRAALESLPLEQIESVIDELHQTYVRGRQVLVVGNGGSAATASHLACDLGKTILGRPVNVGIRPFKVVSLADNMALITAWANDFNFDEVFAQQLKMLGQPDDLLVVITGSGNSPNVVAAVKVAQQLGMRSVGLLGFDGGQVKAMLDRYILVNSNHYGHVEDLHMLLVHLITAHFSRVLRSGAGL